MSDEVTVKTPYAPVFPGILNSLKAYLASKAKELKFGTSNSVSELPYLMVNVIESRTLSDPDPYLPAQMAIQECSIILRLYTDEANMPKYYDMIVNLLHGWGAERQFLGFEVNRRTLFPIREEINGYTIDVQLSIMYQDYRADTTYPIVNEDDCRSCAAASIYPKLMRVDNVEVTVDKD